MKVLFVYPRFQRHADSHPELRAAVPMNEYLGSPSLGMAALAAVTPDWVELEYRDDRLSRADIPTDADVVALSFFTPAASRGIELAKYFKEQGKQVVAGGIFPTMMPDEIQPYVDAVGIGEGELYWTQLLEDARKHQLKPRYSSCDPLDLTKLPLPKLSMYFDREDADFAPDDYPVQLSRGCPLSCEACVLPVSMTAKMRAFTLEHVMGQLDQLAAAGKRASLTEDTSWMPGVAARRTLSAIFDRFIEEGRTAQITYAGISPPQLLAASEDLLTRARKAGIGMFYLVTGFDPITKRAFAGTDPKALARCEESIQRCHDLGIEPYTGFVIGNDQDDMGTVDRMLEFAERTKIRKAEFSIFTPYPGTPSFLKFQREGRIIDRHWGHYNDCHVVFRPAQMTPDELMECYLSLWREFYSDKFHLADLPQLERTIQF